MEEEVSKLVTKIGFELDESGQSAIKQFYNFLTTFQKQVANIPINIALNNHAFDQLSSLQTKLAKLTPAKLQPHPNLDSPNYSKNQNPKNSTSSIWNALSAAEKRKINSTLKNAGLGNIKQSPDEKYFSYLDLIRETANAGEKERTKIYKNATNKRLSFFGRMFSNFSKFILHYRTFTGPLAGLYLLSKGAQASYKIQSQAMLSNMSTDEVQKMQGLASALMIQNPDNLFRALNIYRMKTQNYRMSDVDIMQKMIAQAKTPGAHPIAAQMNGITPDVFRALKNYNGNLIQDLQKQSLVLTPETLKTVEKANIAVNRLKDASLFALSSGISTLFKFIENQQKLIDKIAQQKNSAFAAISNFFSKENQQKLIDKIAEERDSAFAAISNFFYKIRKIVFLEHENNNASLTPNGEVSQNNSTPQIVINNNFEFNDNPTPSTLEERKKILSDPSILQKMTDELQSLYVRPNTVQ